MALIDAIKTQYPNPWTAGTGTGPSKILTEEQPYCVGGAVCLYAGVLFRFPPTSTIARALTKLNSTLPYELAYAYAKLITEHNDAGRFAEAWNCVDSALTYEAATDIA